MGILSLSISFVVIAVILCFFILLIRKNENNVKYAVSIVYPEDDVVPKQIVQAELLKMLTGGLVILVVTFILGLIFIHFQGNVLIAHILLIIPILIYALIFRRKMNYLDKKYRV